MVTGVDKRDQDLMNKYKFCGLHFTEPTLNSKVVKNLTCRRSITKGLNQPVFYGIHYDNNSNVLMVGLNENARLYSKEELKKAAEACQASTSPNAAESVYGRPFKPNPHFCMDVIFGRLCPTLTMDKILEKTIYN
uniref:Sema domain-containing protein n=1 Tax=Angiostrongylus cantonensis TaxID=6313 RepID=A0A0K0D4X5_ANGCA